MFCFCSHLKCSIQYTGWSIEPRHKNIQYIWCFPFLLVQKTKWVAQILSPGILLSFALAALLPTLSAALDEIMRTFVAPGAVNLRLSGSCTQGSLCEPLRVEMVAALIQPRKPLGQSSLDKVHSSLHCTGNNLACHPQGKLFPGSQQDFVKPSIWAENSSRLYLSPVPV